ncbi:aldo/keto reductase [Nonomuraea sp. NN258]|uniref:aldo/keto reductase n=1 Tax=Nonomuraea antri TaxID=2730852 RepID=UPI001568C3F0|nr:aldo/keto reductase [Nonomuraea antri]NRQ36265.1 aldo/keto reductase [Nonomuraea antri]
MRYRLLGQTGLRVSQLFLGAMGFAEHSPQVRRMFDRYAEAGGNVVDTADAYGDSENVVGELLRGRRDRFVLATKYTLTRDATDLNAGGSHRKNLVLSLESSLRRLRTDYIDLYWVHVWDPHTPIEETMRALDDAVRAGKILYAGISDAPAWLVSRANTLAEWRGWTPFAGLQVPYNVGWRDIERELLPMARAYGMTVAAWRTLGRGVLSGRPGAQETPEAAAVREVAAELGVSPAQVAIAWTLARGVHPIVGASTIEQLEDNLGAVDVTLPEEAMRRLESASDFRLGFPADFVGEHAPQIFGRDYPRLDGR